jgi:1-phosphofructokinase family hexose kinase
MTTQARIITLTLNPALDITQVHSGVKLGAMNRAQSAFIEASGKGINVAQAAAKLGTQSVAIAPLGDVVGQAISSLLSDTNFELVKIPIAGASRCNFKLLDGSQVTEFNASGPNLDLLEWQTLETTLLRRVQNDSVVVLAGSLPRGIQSTVYADLARKIQLRGARVVVDAEGSAFELALKTEPWLVKPNRVEAEMLLGTKIQDLSDAVAAARRIQALGAQNVLLSLGGEGAIMLTKYSCFQASPPRVQVKNTIGCGDALLAGTIVGITQNMDWTESLRYGTAVALARALMLSPSFPTAAVAKRRIAEIQITSNV